MEVKVKAGYSLPSTLSKQAVSNKLIILTITQITLGCFDPTLPVRHPESKHTVWTPESGELIVLQELIMLCHMLRLQMDLV